MRCGKHVLTRAAVCGLMVCSTAPVSATRLVDLAGGSSGGRVVEQQRYAMGTMFRVVAREGASVDATRRAVRAALDEVVRLDRVLSHYDERSDLSRLTREGAGRLVSVHPDLYAVITRALDMSRRSEGRFDITVGPLVRAWRAARERGGRPTDDELQRAAACVGYQKIVVRPPDGIMLHADCMSLDLGAIGKGYAVDRAIEVLTAQGVGHAVVNAGGSTIKAIGSAPGFDGWPVRTATAVDGRTVVQLRGTALSTSQQHAEIIEPGTRAPATSTLSVTVLAASAATADALSTALLLSTEDERRTMLRGLDGVSASWAPAAREDGSTR